VKIAIMGAGMAGLAAAVRLRELGVDAVVREKGNRPGGSMLLSSCVIWRFREWEDFRAECPTGDERLQRIVWERLDDAIDWLVSLGAPVVWKDTGNPRIVGKRFDPVRLTEVLAKRCPDLSMEWACAHMPTETSDATILCTGGFQADDALVQAYINPAGPLRLRANRWSTGDGLRLARARGAALSDGMDEFYGRNMPDADFTEADFVPKAQLYGRFSRVYNEDGEEFFRGKVSWSENDLVQATAHQPHARAWYVLDDAALSQRLRDRTVAELVAEAPTRVETAELPFSVPSTARAAVRVAPGITHTIGGLRIDGGARVLDETGHPIEGLWAAGADVGGISTGGYASGLAAALVFGRIAAETVCADG
jgi:succinate dehydrogenase/fumarate reductase flavoprotein subunit